MARTPDANSALHIESLKSTWPRGAAAQYALHLSIAYKSLRTCRQCSCRVFMCANVFAAMAAASAFTYLKSLKNYDCQLTSQKRIAGRWALPIGQCPSNQPQCLSMYWVDWIWNPYLWYSPTLNRYGSRTDVVRAQFCLGTVSVRVIRMHGTGTRTTGTGPVPQVRDLYLRYGAPVPGRYS